MVSKGDKIALYISGQPVPIQECNVVITQPSIKQIILNGEQDFFSIVNILGNMHFFAMKIRQGHEGELDNYSDFQIALAMLSQDATVRKQVEKFFQLVFPQYLVDVESSEIRFALTDNPDRIIGMVNPFNVEIFEQTISDLFIMRTSDKQEYKAANAKAQKIIDKFNKAKIKKAELKGGVEESFSLYGNYVSILSIGIGLDINILLNYTPFQLSDALNRYLAKTESDFYTRVSTMPMMDTSKMEQPKEWTRNLY